MGPGALPGGFTWPSLRCRRFGTPQRPRPQLNQKPATSRGGVKCDLLRDSVRPSASRRKRNQKQGQASAKPPVHGQAKRAGFEGPVVVWANWHRAQVSQFSRSVVWAALYSSFSPRQSESSSSFPPFFTFGSGGLLHRPPGGRWSPSQLSRSGGSSRRGQGTGGRAHPCA